jgi:hypothetical protein
MESTAGLAPGTSSCCNSLYKLWVLIPVFLSSGCFQHYYRTHTQTKVRPGTLDSLIMAKRYFVMHDDHGNTAGLKETTVLNNTLRYQTTGLPESHSRYLNPNRRRPNQVYRRDKSEALNEVHLYTSRSVLDTGTISFPVDSTQRMDVYTFDAKRTKDGIVLSIIGFVGVAALTAGIVAAASFAMW